ncbi:DNA phosphorothioation-dependent restriction protein DptH [Paenisporosarcina sp. OV554]|uniref:DNA phosphorothioation-dependent restriction protein DptH n=1 Tax=Paenisporosarcina sp. OV554 TaxID=2135694 RepID=UPI000D49327F|nr:DNA phosphorothioation-dependent restriction protein DptH [Paenisporosarcina sp. OV554]PUB13379.1 DNA phosphorothioation-dependent restriction protein DptH [Paenisporosarcina sp. OV554]
MLNPFYDYIGGQLVNFFRKESDENRIDRYYLYLPEENLVDELIQVLKTDSHAEKFVYQHESSLSKYETFSLVFNQTKFVIASTNDNTSIDFLVTLRNEMSEQKGQWKNTALIMICNTLNDSIKGGSRDLTSEGLPLHVSQIVGNLEELLFKCELIDSEKVVLRHYLNKREAEHRIENSSFLDFEDVLSLLKKARLDQGDFAALNYFPDSNLEKLVEIRDSYEYENHKWKKEDKNIASRLEENTSLFEDVERTRLLGNEKEKLEDQFDKGAMKLRKEDWASTDFQELKEWMVKVNERKEISFDNDKVKSHLVGEQMNLGLTTWLRPKSDTAAGRRNWSLIVFHPDYIQGETIEIRFPFDRNTSDKFLNATSLKFTKSKGHSLIVSIKLEELGRTFKRMVYKHEDSTSSSYSFNILVIKSKEDLLQTHKSSYYVNAGSKSNSALQLELNDQKLLIGSGGETALVQSVESAVTFNDGVEIHFELGLLDEMETSFKFMLNSNDFVISIEIKDIVLRVVPIEPMRIWEKKINSQNTYFGNDDFSRVEIDQLPFVTHEQDRKFYMFEKQWLSMMPKRAKLTINEMVEEPLFMPAKLEEAYNNFLNLLKETNTIPSFTYYSDELAEYAEKYIEEYVDAIDNISDGELMKNDERDFLYLGALFHENEIYMTPFSPLNVAYQLQLTKETAGESIDSNILKRLKAAYTIPFLIGADGRLFKPDSTNRIPEWQLFKPREEVSIGETNNYLAQVVQEKINQFMDHYDYLFEIDSKSALLLNIVNINNDREILKGIINWFKIEITKNNSLSNLRDIVVTSYNISSNIKSAFDLMNEIEEPSVLKDELGIDINIKDFYSEDVLRAIQSSLQYAKRDISEQLEYSHVTFYKMKSKEHIAKQKVDQAPSSINLGGIYTTVSSHRTEDGGYRVGFGIGDAKQNQTLLTKYATKINELSANRTNGGHDPYMKNIAFALHINNEDEKYLAELYKNSHWLTFIDPAVDLKYFQESSSNLVIVHYSDQLSSTSHFDAITVTDKSNQYFKVIKEFLSSQQIAVEDERIEEVIKAFNTFNGEWLLRAVQGKSHDKREKMSIVSAIKRSLLFFETENIVWVPISMEEIVRVTGNIKLSKKEGIFSGKTIGKKGNCSDDLLMMGLELTEDEKVLVHMYPVEVKIGNNQSSVIEKGISQVIALKERLEEQLLKENNFDSKFLRNFFARVLINNANKMKLNNIWPEKDYTITSSMIDKLLNDDFEITSSLRADFGQGMVMSFKKGITESRQERKNGVIVYEIPEQEGYATLAVSMEKLKMNDFSEIEIVELPEIIDEEIFVEPVPIYPPVKPRILEEKPKEKDAAEQEESYSKIPVVQPPIKIVDPEEEYEVTPQIRPLMGIERNESIHWEFNHSQLSNRHLLIGGRSGQGKTYFIQSLLQNFSKSGQPALVIDYSSSFTTTQLDQAFLASVGDKLHERIVYHDKFPINPFIRREKEVAGRVSLEKTSEVARRVQDVFAAVYKSFGPQQKNAIYEATKAGIDMYGDKMRMEHLLERIEALETYSSSVLQSVSSRLVQFVDIDPFDYNGEAQWDNYFNTPGQITIIQLAGYDQDEIKRIMTEFILWDLWYYTQRGTKDKPIPVVLDEAQNLDFSDGSPTAKVLREGRKFGWSAMFATQTFSNFEKNELAILDNAGTKVYFNPAESELKVIANRIGNADIEDLRSLRKGQCMVLGQFMKSNGTMSNPEHHIVQVPEIKSE